MTNTTARTPGPWRLDPKRSLRVVAGEDHTVCATGNSDHLRDQWEANAAFIVRAANSHDEMLAALQALEAALRKDSRDKTVLSDTVEYHLDGQAMYHAINLARAALAKARQP